MRFARHPSFRESSSCFDDTGLSFHPPKRPKITSSTCISLFSLSLSHSLSLSAQVEHGVQRCWSSLDELFRRVDHEDTRNDQGYQALSRPLDISFVSYVSHLEIALLRTTPIIRIPYFAIFPGTVPSSLPSPPSAAPLFGGSGFYDHPPHQATSLPKTTAFTYVTGVSKRALAAGLKETSPHDGVFRLVASSHSELDKHACTPACTLPTWRRRLFFETPRASSAIPLRTTLTTLPGFVPFPATLIPRDN